MEIRRMTSPNHNVGRGGQTPDMIVKHTSGNTTQSAINTVMNRANQVSYNFIIAGASFRGHGIVPEYKDGDIIQMVDIKNTAWHSGIDATIRNSTLFKNNAHPIVQRRTQSPNQYTIGIAFGDMNLNGGRLTEAQIASSIWLIKHIQAEVKRIYGYTIPLTRKHIIGHNEINPVNRPNCPGNIQWDRIIAGVNTPVTQGNVGVNNQQSPQTETLRFNIFGKEHHFEGFIVEGRSFSPVRGLLESMGYRVGWDGITRTITVRNE